LGQKVHPIGFRLGVIQTWDSKWFATRDYPKLVYEDRLIRDYIKARLSHAGIARVEVERAANKAKIRIHTARPGIVIGKKGAEIEALRQDLERKFKREILIDIQEVRRPELDATLVAENVALQLVRRVAFRRAMKRAVNALLKNIDRISLIRNRVLLIGATNHPQLLDEAAWRRFDEVIPFDLPDLPTRELILRRLLTESETHVDIAQVAEQTEGFSGADLKMLVREAILSALTDGRTELTRDDIIKGELLIKTRDEHKARNWI